MARPALAGIVRRGIVAGAAGGAAEVLWISFYSASTGASAATVARGVTDAIGMNALLPTASLVFGIIIHMAMAVALGIALAMALRAFSAHLPQRAVSCGFVLAVLTGVWAINFFIVLPSISPAFVLLVPYPVSLFSKLLFGMAAAAVLRHHARRRGDRVDPGEFSPAWMTPPIRDRAHTAARSRASE
jgi:hypothetical protein